MKEDLLTMKMLLKDGKKKVLTLSYDDGVVQDKRLVQILDQHGLKCTFNINSGMYCQDAVDPEYGRLTKASAIELFRNSNHEVAVHGYTHPFLERLSTTEMIREITEDRKSIEEDFGVIARGMAYPFGTYNDEVVDVLAKCHIAYARTVHSTCYYNFPDNWLTLHPTCHHNQPNLMELAKNFIEQKFRTPMMFYLWGHSYEFDDRNNWNVIEEFAEYMGGRDDIWYATNIEIYDYVMAYKRLETSYDLRLIHNPSAIDVWFETSNVFEASKAYCVKAGETITL